MSKQPVTKTHLAYCRLKEVSIEAQTAFVPGCKHGERPVKETQPLPHTHVLASNFQPQVLPLLSSAIAVYAMSSKSLFTEGERKKPHVFQNNFYFHTCVFPAVTCSEKACGILASSSTVISPTSLTLQLVKTKIIRNLKLSLG